MFSAQSNEPPRFGPAGTRGPGLPPESFRGAELPRGTERVLVVEDEVDVRCAIRRVLERLGYRVVEAINGAEAIGILDTTLQKIHLVITDVMMPELNGRALGEWIQDAAPQLRVLYMSGYSDPNMAPRSRSEAEIVLLQKPFEARALALAVRAILDAPDPDGSSSPTDL